MTEQDDTNNSALDAFDLADFIAERSELFVVMGVFGALAIYISQSRSADLGSDAALMINTGFVSAFAISLIMYGLIYWKLIEAFGDWHELYRAHFRARNAPLAAFTVFSMLLGLSVSFLIFQNEPVVFLIVVVGTVVVALGIVVRVTYGVARRVPDGPWWRLSAVFLTSLVTLGASQWTRSALLAGVEVTTIQNMAWSDPASIGLSLALILVVTIRSFASLGVVVSIIGIPVILIDKFRGTGPYGE